MPTFNITFLYRLWAFSFIICLSPLHSRLFLPSIFPSSVLLVHIYPLITLLVVCLALDHLPASLMCMSGAARKRLSFPLLSCFPRLHKLLSAPKPPKHVIVLLQSLGLLSSIFPLLALQKLLSRASFPPLNTESFSDLKAISPSGISKDFFPSSISKHISNAHSFPAQQFRI